MNTLIKPAASTDIDIIYDFVCGLENEQFDKNVFRQCFAANLDKKYTHYLLAIADGAPVGFISCMGQILLHHNGLVYEIQEMYVQPEYRSRGVGKKLLGALLAQISKDNYVLLEVCSSFKRTDAHRFYETNGFEKTTYKFKKLP